MIPAPPDYDPLDDGLAPGRDGVPRDQWDRPLLIPRGGGPRTAYTSASTLADSFSDTFGLDIWDRRMIAKGIGLSQELAARAGAEQYHTGFGEKDEKANKESGRRLDAICEEARQLAKAHQKRDYGTAFHGYTEPGNTAMPPDYMQADVASFWKELDRYGIEIVATEVFIANDDLGAAGTFDHLVKVPGYDGLVVLDKKTGVYHPEATKIQLAIYAGGEVYEFEPEERRLSFTDVFGVPVRQDFGITAHTPALTGVTTLYREPLDIGRRAAKVAVWVREYLRTYGRSSVKGTVLELPS